MLDTPPAVRRVSPRSKVGRFYHSSTATLTPGRATGRTLISRCFARRFLGSGLPDPTEIRGRVDGSVVDTATLGAYPFAHGKRVRLPGVPARAAPPGRGEATVYLHEGLAIPLALVLKLTNELAPRGIADRLRYLALLTLPIVVRTIGSVLLFPIDRLLLCAQVAVGVLKKAARHLRGICAVYMGHVVHHGVIHTSGHCKAAVQGIELLTGTWKGPEAIASYTPYRVRSIHASKKPELYSFS